MGQEVKVTAALRFEELCGNLQQLFHLSHDNSYSHTALSWVAFLQFNPAISKSVVSGWCCLIARKQQSSNPPNLSGVCVSRFLELAAFSQHTSTRKALPSTIVFRIKPNHRSETSCTPSLQSLRTGRDWRDFVMTRLQRPLESTS